MQWVNVDLNYFNFITPCGIQNKEVTSLEKELGRKISMQEVKEKVAGNFETVFEARISILNKQKHFLNV